jgi:hypothetical protein
MPFATFITEYVQQIIHHPPAISSFSYIEQDVSLGQSSSLIFSMVKPNASPSRYILPSTTSEERGGGFSPLFFSDLHLHGSWLIQYFSRIRRFEGVNILYLFWLGKFSRIYSTYTVFCQELICFKSTHQRALILAYAVFLRICPNSEFNRQKTAYANITWYPHTCTVKNCQCMPSDKKKRN